VLLTRELTADAAPRCDLLVIITNTRSASRAEAVACSTELGQCLRRMGVTGVFKKCDSVLRGHVAAELHALINALGKDGALLLPANPSMGRDIINGRYVVGGKPITETPFAHDPEFPAKSDDVVSMLGEGCVISANSDVSISGGQIYIGNVAAEEVMRIYCARLTDSILPAGGAGFFRAYLEHRHRHSVPHPRFEGFSPQRLLMICGSTIAHDDTMRELSSSQIVIDEMPAKVYSGDASPDEWINRLDRLYRDNRGLTVRINQPISREPSYAVRLKHTMADVARRIVTDEAVDNLIVEGGATAYCVIERLGWRNFEVVDNLSPGVITLRPQESDSKMLFTLKPGSYSWPERLIKQA
jgi:uncharacterized protein YgbK (DUF1537 family)